MIESVSFEKTVFEHLPFKFEAGTPDYVATTGLAKAIDYMTAVGMDNIQRHEHELTEYAMQRLSEVDAYSAVRRARAPSYRSSSVTYTTSTWALCSTVSASPCAQGTTAHSPS